MDFEWVKDKTHKENLSQLYYDYNVIDEIKFKVQNYGVLKSAELSIIET